MSVYRKVQSVERVFNQLEREIATLKASTGISCISGCGLCCQKPDISATPLEFLPLAYYAHKQGKSMSIWEALRANKEQAICHLFRPVKTQEDSGLCGSYAHRGLICRLFGFSAMLDKHNNPQFVSCRTMKTERKEAHDKTVAHIQQGKKVPIMRNYYYQLQAIDSNLGMTLMPINQAIEKALETVMSYYAYRKPMGA
jgi:Fe-S-cluster containining protein